MPCIGAWTASHPVEHDASCSDPVERQSRMIPPSGRPPRPRAPGSRANLAGRVVDATVCTLNVLWCASHSTSAVCRVARKHSGAQVTINRETFGVDQSDRKAITHQSIVNLCHSVRCTHLRGCSYFYLFCRVFGLGSACELATVHPASNVFDAVASGTPFLPKPTSWGRLPACMKGAGIGRGICCGDCDWRPHKGVRCCSIGNSVPFRS